MYNLKLARAAQRRQSIYSCPSSAWAGTSGSSASQPAAKQSFEDVWSQAELGTKYNGPANDWKILPGTKNLVPEWLNTRRTCGTPGPGLVPAILTRTSDRPPTCRHRFFHHQVFVVNMKISLDLSGLKRGLFTSSPGIEPVW
jgi:hypothetical protein